MNKIVLSLLATSFGFACSSPQKELTSINVPESFKTEQSITLSDVVEELEYVKLETNSACLISQSPRFVVLENSILAYNKREGCLMFDRKTGKFIKEIGHKGKDADGYASTLSAGSIMVDEMQQHIFFRNWKNGRTAYNTDGEKLYTIPNKEYGAFACLGENKYAQGILNFGGDAEHKVALYNDTVCDKRIPNQERFKLKSDGMCVLNFEEHFYAHNGKTYFKSLMNDTVFTVSNEFQPAYRFDLGDKAPKIEFKENPGDTYKELMKTYSVKDIIETDGYIFYTILHEDEDSYLIYDKKKKQGELCKSMLEAEGSAIWPHNTNKKNELIFVINPVDMEEEVLKKYNLREDDNPIIAIGKYI